MSPKVSVVIVTKNRAQYLFHAIQSVLKQSFTNFELIVIDAASTDNTEDIVRKSFSDARIRYVRLIEDVGLSRSRNLGIKLSRSNFIAFLDDDDLWMPNKLETQLKAIEDKNNIGAVYTGYLKIDSDGRIVGVRLPFLRGKIYPRILYKNFIGGCSTILVKKECLEKVGMFDEVLCYAEDWDLWIRVAKYYPFDYIKEPLVLCRVHNQQLTSTIGLHRLQNFQYMYKKHMGELLKYKKALGAWHYNLGILYFEFGNTKNGRKAFLQSIFYDPTSIHYYARLFFSLFGLRYYKLLSTHVHSNLRSHLGSRIQI
ncbi:MAG: glycosyltransferase [Nitrososphaeria archaeon]